MTISYKKITKHIFFVGLAVGIFSILGYVLKTYIGLPTDIKTNTIEELIPHIFILLTLFTSFLVGIISLGVSKTTILLIITFIVSFILELSSTYNGFPYGLYKYSDKMGFKLLGEVPFLIPLSWFSIILPSLVISYKLGFRGYPVVLFSSILVLIWDLSLEYFASYIKKFWIWEEGFFYTMPIENWFGWFLTALVIYSIYWIMYKEDGENIQYCEYAFFNYLLITLFSSLFSLFYGGIIPGFLTIGGVAVLILYSISRGIKLWSS
ncbi:MAG: carotenoid biosynthesis protein [Brevinematales bacterium]|nr:carotenoid biosynthesis protein [Brevinematales bacterium]